ncbi:MAG: response regulator [Planctomycetota bacterium]|nr:MAG: response regulator [Planctomycetota bacterium]
MKLLPPLARRRARPARTGRAPPGWGFGVGSARGGVVGRDAYRELFERSADAILIIEEERFVDCNQAAVDMLGYARKQDLLRTHPSQLSPERQSDGRDSYEKANEMIRIAFEQGSHRFEWLHKRASGEVFPVEVLLTAIEEEGRRTLHVVWRDISERKRLEEQLRHALKLEAIGKVAGGIAHDFNNLLVPILAYGDLLERELAGNERALELVREVVSAGKRAAELTDQLLAYSRRQVLEPRVLDLRDEVARARRLLERLVGEDVTIEQRATSESCKVLADPGQIQRVLFNLATNARDAMGGKGTLSFTTGVADLRSELLGLETDLPAGRYALLEVSDTGCGIEAEVLPKIFDPFFTTKPVGEGTGLGLSTVVGIVRQSGGDVRVETEVGRGTTFRIFFPLTTAEPTPRTEPVAAVSTWRGSESILLAEDQPRVAKLLRRVLSEAGYTVAYARDGAEALELYEAGVPCDLLVTDVVMPNTDGPTLARTLRERVPDLKVLFVSGYTREALDLEGLSEPGTLLLRKPFTAEGLLRKLRLLLDG